MDIIHDQPVHSVGGLLTEVMDSVISTYALTRIKSIEEIVRGEIDKEKFKEDPSFYEFCFRDRVAQLNQLIKDYERKCSEKSPRDN